MPGDVTYDLTIGSQSASSKTRDSERRLLSLVIELGMDGTGGRCIAELADAEYTPPEPGDPLVVRLDAGDDERRVFTGEVESVEATATSQRVAASDGLVKLARLDVEAAYAEVTIDSIVKELMQQAGVEPGTVEKGPRVPSFVLFKGPRALRHIQGLAELCGVDLYTDGEGKAHFAGPSTAGDLHSFQYGENVRELSIKEIEPVFDGVEFWGEGAASSQGADKYYWLPTDLSGVNAKASLAGEGSVSSGGSGKRPRQLCSGALRFGEAVNDLAEACMQAVAGRRIQGYIKVFGSPGVTPGDHVKIEALPDHHTAAGIFKDAKGLRIRRVRHVLDMQAGFVTRMDL
jgi:hypothetical protein